MCRGDRPANLAGFFCLAFKQPEQKAQQDTDNDHAGDGKIKTRIFFFDDDIAG